MSDTVSSEQAYRAMLHFLKGLYNDSQDPVLGTLVADMCLTEDKTSADPAMRFLFEMSVGSVLKNEDDPRLIID